MNAPTIDLPRDGWQPYFNLLSKVYRGWDVTVETLADRLGDQPEAQREPFQGISYETKGSRAGDILVEVGDAGTAYLVHDIEKPRAVRVADTQPGAETDIEIEAADGTVRLVHIRRHAELPPPPA